MPSKPNKITKIAIQEEPTDYVKPYKNSERDVESRVEEVFDLILVGSTRADILRHCANKWKIAERQSDEYFYRAQARLREINKVNAEDNMAIITNGLWRLYKTCMSQDDMSEARQVLMSIAKIKGLDQQNIHLTVEKIDPEIDKMNDDDLSLMLNEDDN